MKYVLIGFMGAGKSSLLKRLSPSKQADLDVFLEGQHQCTVADLIAHHGLEGFRKLELNAFEKFFKLKSGVFALGGGTMQAHAQELLERQKAKQIILVWLKTPFEVCWERIKNSAAQRPLVHQGQAALLDLYQKRQLIEQKALIWLDQAQQGQIGSLDDLQNWPRRIDDEAR